MAVIDAEKVNCFSQRARSTSRGFPSTTSSATSSLAPGPTLVGRLAVATGSLDLVQIYSVFEDLFSPHWLSDLLCFSHPRQEDSISISVFLFCKQTWPSSRDL